MAKSNHNSYYSKTQTDKVREEFHKEIKALKPTHFLTLQFPITKRTANFDKSKKYLYSVMHNFECRLLGRHWNKKHLEFIAFAEHGKSEGWHYHILFNSGEFTTEQLETALDITTTRKKLHNEAFMLKPITSTPDCVYKYCTKETRADGKCHFDSKRFIPSRELFDLPNKTTYCP
jgi:hypothetical protein